MASQLYFGTALAGITIDGWGNVAANAFRGFPLNPARTFGTVTVSGTYSGTAPSQMYMRLKKVSDNSVVVDWTALTGSAPSGGNYSGSIQCPPTPSASFSALYREVRADLAGATATNTEPLAVGLCIAAYGQSNMANMTNASASGTTSVAGTCWYHGATNGSPSATNTWVPVSTGASPNNRVISEFYNALIAKTGVCCFGYAAPTPAAAIIGLVEGGSTGAFDVLKVQTQYIGGLNAIIYYQGESDCGYTGTATPARAYHDRLVNGIHVPICGYAGRTPADVPFYLCSLAPNAPLVPDEGEERMQIMLDTLMRCGDYSPYVHYSHSNRDFDMTTGDGLHIGPVDGTKCCKRWAHNLANYWGYEPKPVQWYITAANAVNATTTTVTMVHSLGTDFTPTSAITGFEVSSDNGANWATCTGVRTNATTITLTHASVGTTRKLRYNFHLMPPIANMVKDNSYLAVPLNYTPLTWIDVVPAAGGRKPQPTWLENFRQGTFTNVGSYLYEIPDMYIGPASSDRAIFVNAANGLSTATVTSMTVIKAGQSNITGVVDYTAGNAGAITHAVVPSAYGKFVTVRLQFSGPADYVSFALYVVKPSEMTSMVKVDGDNAWSASASTLSVNMSTTAGGFIFAAGEMIFNDASPSSFSGTEVWKTDREKGVLVDGISFGFPFGNAVNTVTATNTNTVTVTFTSDDGPHDMGLIAASFA